MSRSSPGVKRLLSPLNFFADHPGQAFTLTDLVRALKLSRATCHGLLTGLVEAGYLYRTSDKTYLLGPALVAIGEVAKTHFSPLQAAQPEMRALADAYDVTCSATFRESSDVVVRERAAAASHLGSFVPRGSRLPLLPQFASLFFVWSAPGEIADWLDDLDPAPSAMQRDAVSAGAAFIREHGFLFGVRNIRSESSEELRDWVHQPEYEQTPVFPLFAIDAAQSYQLVFVQAPVLDAQRRVAFVIGLQGFAGQHMGAEIEAIGARLSAACARVSAFMAHGPR